MKKTTYISCVSEYQSYVHWGNPALASAGIEGPSDENCVKEDQIEKLCEKYEPHPNRHPKLQLPKCYCRNVMVKMMGAERNGRPSPVGLGERREMHQ